MFFMIMVIIGTVFLMLRFCDLVIVLVVTAEIICLSWFFTLMGNLSLVH